MRKNENKTDTFYLKKVPQSEYRMGKKTKSIEKIKSQYIDITLNKIICKKEEKKILMDKIKKESQRLVELLISEEKVPEINQEKCLKEIYKKLGFL